MEDIKMHTSNRYCIKMRIVPYQYLLNVDTTRIAELVSISAHAHPRKKVVQTLSPCA